ncbi:hypothetical protein [Clostridium sp.]|uniref:hypothetical protein n=1 Tax=Clostridium sp. TaxID=1506 RepID=UPI0032172055
MPSRKSYNRFFIILQEDQKGYGLDSNKTPSGYAKLEVRNDKAKASFYVQNLKKQKGPYCMILIVQGKIGKELVNLGQINIDNGGKADVSNEFDANNLANTNISMDNVQGAAIGRINSDKVMPVMVGFTGGEELKNWHTSPIAKNNSNTTKENNNITKQVKETPKSYNENMNEMMPQGKANNANMTQKQTGTSKNVGTGSTVNEADNPMGSINPSMGDMNSNTENLNKPNPTKITNPAPGATVNEAGNPMGSINPSMGDMNSDMGNLNNTVNAPNPININNPAPGAIVNEAGNPMGSINPSMGDVNSNMGNLSNTVNTPNPINITNPAPGATVNEAGNPMGSINPSMGDMNSNTENLNNAMPNTRSDGDRVSCNTCNQGKAKGYEDYINDEVDIIDVEEIKPVVKSDVLNEQLESDDGGYRDEENKIFEEYEKEIERLKDYRKKHSKKKNKCDDESINKKHEDCKHEKHKKCEWNDKNYPIGDKGKFFKEVIYGLEKIGVNENIKNCFWYKAHVKKLEDMYCVYDYNKYSVVFYPMICYYPYISRHGNFMVGYKCDDEGNLKYIIYAIPGTRNLVDQPYEGKTGFVTFMPDEDNDKTGHWLMYYDIKGNTVVVPVKR